MKIISRVSSMCYDNYLMYINISFFIRDERNVTVSSKKETVSNKIDSAFFNFTIIGQVNNRAVLQKGVHKLL